MHPKRSGLANKPDHGQLFMANMTLFAPDGLEMIMMERFEGLTTHVDCKGDDGEMSLTFKSKQAFDYAMQTWSHINKKVEDKFILIANHDGCGPDDERQSYFITQVEPDVKSLTTFLTAKPAEWSEIAHTYDIDFGHAQQLAAPHLQPRWFGSSIVHSVVHAVSSAAKAVGKLVDSGVGAVENFFEDGAHFTEGFIRGIANIFVGNAEFSKSMDFPVGVRNENERSNIYSDSTGRLKLDCVNCFVAGSFLVTGRVSVHHFHIQDLSIAAAPRNVHAALVLEASIEDGDADDINEAKELFSAPIPGVGIVIPGIFKLGGVLSYEVGFSATFKGAASIQFGLKASIPDESILLVNVADPGKSNAAGFRPAVDPVFDVKQLEASLSVSAYSQPKLFFGIEVIGAAKADVSLAIRLPEVSASFTPKFDEEGACRHIAGASKTGVDIDSHVKISLVAGAEASFLQWGKDWSKELLGYSWPIFDTCMPVSLPGLAAAKGSLAPSIHGGLFRLPFPKVPILPPGQKFPGIARLAYFPIPDIPTALPVIKKPYGLVLPSPLKSAVESAISATSQITYGSGGLPTALPSTSNRTAKYPIGTGVHFTGTGSLIPTGTGVHLIGTGNLSPTGAAIHHNATGVHPSGASGSAHAGAVVHHDSTGFKAGSTDSSSGADGPGDAGSPNSEGAAPHNHGNGQYKYSNGTATHPSYTGTYPTATGHLN